MTGLSTDCVTDVPEVPRHVDHRLPGPREDGLVGVGVVAVSTDEPDLWRHVPGVPARQAGHLMPTSGRLRGDRVAKPRGPAQEKNPYGSSQPLDAASRP